MCCWSIDIQPVDYSTSILLFLFFILFYLNLKKIKIEIWNSIVKTILDKYDWSYNIWEKFNCSFCSFCLILKEQTFPENIPWCYPNF